MRGNIFSPKNLTDYGTYLLVRLAICVIQALPMSLCQQWTPWFARFLWQGVRLRRKVIKENLQNAFPELSTAEQGRIALAMWEHLMVMVVEIAHAPRKIHITNWREHTSFPDMQILVRRLLAPRPFVILSGHFGNFEMGGYLMGLHGFPTYTIARPLDNHYLDRFVNQFRGATGQYMLSKFGSSRQIASLLEQGATLVLLGDQYGGTKACWVDFFGRPASTNKAVAIFTLLGDVPTATCGVIRTEKPLHFEMRMADLIDPTDEDFKLDSIPDIIGWYTECLERLIRVAPEQYWWVHRRWKEKLTHKRSSRNSRQKHAA